VYSYNFPDDKLIVKFLGKYQRSFHRFKYRGTLHSILRFSSGNRSNNLEWGRCLLLVHRRIRKYRKTQRLSFQWHRHTYIPWYHCIHRPRVFLLPDLDVEAAIIEALYSHCIGKYAMSSASDLPDSGPSIKLTILQLIGSAWGGIEVRTTQLSWDA
jgi:hypothetical protein